MANLGELLISLGLDTSDLKKGTKEIASEAKKMQNALSRGHADMVRLSGRYGSQAGRNFTQAYNKELTFIGSALRLGGLNKLAEVLEAGKQYSETSFLGNVGAESIGNYFGNKQVITTPHTVSSAASDLAGEFGANYLLGRKISKAQEKGLLDLQKTFENIQNGTAKAFKASDGFNTFFQNLPDLQKRFVITNKLKDTIRREHNIAASVRRSLMPDNVFQRVAVPTAGRTLASTAGSIGFGGLGLGVLGGTGAAVAGYGFIAKAREEARKAESKHFKNTELIREIENIQDEYEKSARIIKEFGKDGQQVYKDLIKSTQEFETNLQNTTGTRVLGEVSTRVWNSVKGWAVNFGEFASKTWLGVLNIFGIIDYETEAAALRSQRRVEEMEAQTKKIKDDLKAAKEEAAAAQAIIDGEKKAASEAQKRRDEEAKRDSVSALGMASSNWQDDRARAREKMTFEDRLKSLQSEKLLYESIRDMFNKSQTGYWKNTQKIKEKEDEINDVILERSQLYNDLGKKAGQAIKDANMALRERSSRGIDELASRRVLTYTGFVNQQKALAVKNLEWWAKLNRAEGFTAMADLQSKRALQIRGSLEALSNNERYPLQSQMKALTDVNVEIRDALIKNGILVIPTMGE